MTARRRVCSAVRRYSCTARPAVPRMWLKSALLVVWPPTRDGDDGLGPRPRSDRSLSQHAATGHFSRFVANCRFCDSGHSSFTRRGVQPAPGVWQRPNGPWPPRAAPPAAPASSLPGAARTARRLSTRPSQPRAGETQPPPPPPRAYEAAQPQPKGRATGQTLTRHGAGGRQLHLGPGPRRLLARGHPRLGSAQSHTHGWVCFLGSF